MTIMEKFDPIKMVELVRVEETQDKLTLVFRDNKSVVITVSGDSLVSTVDG